MSSKVNVAVEIQNQSKSDLVRSNTHTTDLEIDWTYFSNLYYNFS